MFRLLSIAILSVFTLSLFVFPSQALAKRKAATSAKGPTFTAVKAKNGRSVTANFGNLSNVKSVAYQLTYDSNKGPQGAGGSAKVGKSKSLSRTLLLGTCSGKVCTYHSAIKNLKLSVDFTLTSGGVVSYEKKL